MMSDVRVPLITLVPVIMTQISEVRLRSDLVVQIEGDDVVVSFPVGCSASSNDDNATTMENMYEPEAGTVASLEITLTPNTGTAGLKKLIEGYERILRAQIPG